MAKLPKIPDVQSILAAGINPSTGLPIKLGVSSSELKTNVKRFLRLIDEQDAINRYKWINLPSNISSQELERWLYYRGQLCFFYIKESDQFYFMPYALEGGLDFYGRFKTVHPVPMNSGSDGNDAKMLGKYLSTIKLNVQYGVKVYQPTESEMYNSCVLLHDYSKQLAETIIPRSNINEPILEVEAECIPLMRTSLMLSTGVIGVRVADADQYASVLDAAKALENAAMEGKPYVPILGPIEFQDLATGQVAKSEEYMLALQSLDNFRLSGYGLDNGGLFQKKAHMLQSEQDVNNTNIGLIYQDGLTIRQNFCNIVNSIWNLGIWCEPAENQVGDLNKDGLMYDRQVEINKDVIVNEGGENDV